MRLILDALYLMTALALSPVVAYRVIRHHRYRHGWAERFGRLRRRSPDKLCIWIHGVSVGEINATRTVVHALAQHCPDHEIVISATTDTGYARALTLYGKDHAVFYYPLDLSLFVRRAFDALNPNLCLLMELEVWPNFLSQAKRRQVPIVVVNGRISDRSFITYQKVKPLLKYTFARIDLILAQTQTYADRFKALGCPSEHVHVTGSLKYDTAQVCDTVEGTEALAARLDLDRVPLWVAGGTGPDEENVILNVFKRLQKQAEGKDLRLVIVPRKPERFDIVAQDILNAGFSLLRYSQHKHGHPSAAIDPRAVILGDTLGDLRTFYSLATVVFVGRSLVPLGGSDMIEAAALGKPTLFGPYTFNFAQTVDALLAAEGAIRVNHEKDLYQAVLRCLRDRPFAEALSQKGRKVILNHQGATERSVHAIVRLLQNET